MKLRNFLLITAAVAGIEIVGVLLVTSTWILLATDIIQ